jgi:hypothetical protein
MAEEPDLRTGGYGRGYICTSRPGERRDPYGADSRFGLGVETFCDKQTPGVMGPGVRRDDVGLAAYYPKKKSPAFRRDLPALAYISSELALGLLARVGLLALTAGILLLLTGLLSAALLLAGLLTRVLILLARVLVLVRHRGLRC